MATDPILDVQRGPSAALDLLERVSLIAAMLGGLAIFLTACVVTLSVVLRNLGLGGIAGDFELVEYACCLCASLFLPLCQLRRGHVMVDLFTNWLPLPTQAVLEGVWELCFAVALVLLGWRLSLGAREMFAYGDATMLLGIPVWLAYVPAIFGTLLSAVIALILAVPMLKGRRIITGSPS